MSALTITGCEKSYSDGLRALQDIDLTIPESDFFVLPEANGGGISAAIGLLCSLINRRNRLEEFFIRLVGDKDMKA